jgi:2-polyprenyl-3-methyl-5-hydroxy-6-metoxy-1,4-benzoquinol methylase
MKSLSAANLEQVPHCPVCGSCKREIVYRSLKDDVFKAVKGEWQLWKCRNCGCAYLDPRPTQASIGSAYSEYFTHEVPAVSKDDYTSLGKMARLRRQITNGYVNWRYGSQMSPALRIGALVMHFFPLKRAKVNHMYRYLPPLPSSGGKILDVGCGDGSFLSIAKMCGWDVAGLEPDHKAVSMAVKSGLEVHHAGMEYFNGQEEIFDIVVLGHVIEHVHEPLELLSACYRVLKPGGALYLETPNIDSYGHIRFGAKWRGIESPRHLVLFSREAISNAILSIGFSSIKFTNTATVTYGMYVKSQALKTGVSPYARLSLPISLILLALYDSLRVFMNPRKSEFLILIAQKS